jgi:peroxiredoxin family protein
MILKNVNELASELAKRCKNSENFEGDMNVAQASHALKCLREIVVEMEKEVSIGFILSACFDIDLEVIACTMARKSRE